MDEKTLIQRLSNGDPGALETAYRLWGAGVYRHAHRILLDSAAAQDITHDLFVRLPETLLGFRGQSALSTWLFRITHNLCLERLRREGNRRDLLERNASGPNPLMPNSTPNAPHEDHDLLHRLLGLLDAETRSLMWLKDGEGWEIDELAKIHEIPAGTIKSRLHRARELMKNTLQQWEAQDGHGIPLPR